MTREDELLKLWGLVEEEIHGTISVECFDLALKEYLRPQTLIQVELDAMIHFLVKKLNRGLEHSLIHRTDMSEIIDLLKQMRTSG